MQMLEDALIEGTGSPDKGLLPPVEKIQAGVGPRVYRVYVSQGKDEGPCREAYCFVGAPVPIPFAKTEEATHKAVSIPVSLLPGVDPDASKAILLRREDNYVVIGLQLSPNVRQEAIGMKYLARDGTEEMVFASPEDFPGLEL